MRISDWSSDVCSSDLPGLTAAAELQVDIRKQLAVQKRAMEAPRRVVGLEAAAERVGADLGAGKTLAGHGHRADRALRGPRHTSAGRQLGIEQITRKSVVSGTRVSVRVDHGGRRVSTITTRIRSN